MKKFIINIASFVFILLVINMVFYAITYKTYFKDYEKVGLTFTSYLLADSHGTPLNQLTQKLGIYNFSAASDSYFDMLRKVKYLVKNTPVKQIIISVDDHSLSPYRENTNNLERSAFYMIKEDYDSIFTGGINSLKKYIVLFNPSIRGIIRSYLQSFIIKKTEMKQWSLLSKKQKHHNSKERFNYQFDFTHPSIALTSSLEEIIDLCKISNIELIGIQFPLTHIYYDTIKNNSFHADEIFRSHKLKVYDFRELYLNHDEYFMNQDHLNLNGSKHFIDILTNSFAHPK